MTEDFGLRESAGANDPRESAGKNDCPIDFDAIDPTRPSGAFALRLARVRAAAGAELTRRRQPSDAFTTLSRWRAPLLAAAVGIAMASAALIRVTHTVTTTATATTEVAATDEVAEALGMSSSVANVILTGDEASASVLFGGLGSE